MHPWPTARMRIPATGRPSPKRWCDWVETRVRPFPSLRIRHCWLMSVTSEPCCGIDCEKSLNPNAIARVLATPTPNGGNTNMSKSNVNPNHYKVAGRERQGEDIAPDAAPTRAPKTATRKARATPLQAPPGRKRGHNLVPGGSGPHARFLRAPRVPVLRPAGAAPQLPPKQATKKASVKAQGSDKRSKRSAAQKRASSRHGFDPMPATNAVPGAFGKEPSPRRPPMRK